MADGFLGRWSRRKQDVQAGKPVQDPPPPARTPAPQMAPPSPSPAPVAAVAAPAVPAAPVTPAPDAPPPPTLADAEALTPASDFKPFVSRAVSPEVRNLAMKKLFSDPHFNVMDGLDIYIGDYTQPDPLPAGMLRKMASAHALGFFDHEKKASASAPGLPGEQAPDAAAVAPISPPASQSRDDAEAQGPADVAQSQVCTAIPSEISSEPSGAPGPAILSAQEAVVGQARPTEHDHDAHLRLQPDDAPQREGVGRGAA